jgi:hypothetical protein
MKALPSREVLMELLDYNPDTGEFLWKERSAKWWKDGYRTAEGYAANFNSRYAGKPAFTAKHKNGSRQAVLFQSHVLAHQVAWKMHFGEEPDQIVHFDGDKSNNRIANLRSVTTSRTRQHDKLPSDNKSGVKGVFWCSRDNMWRAEIGINGKAKYLGRYRDLGEAARVRKLAEDRLDWGVRA